jgi:hypothetical protein
MNPVEAANPFGGFLEVFSGDALDRGLWRHAPGVMRCIVDDHNVPRARHIPERFPNIGLVAQRATLIHANWFREALLGIPIQGVPISDLYPVFAQLVLEARRNKAVTLGWWAQCKILVAGYKRLVFGKSI